MKPLAMPLFLILLGGVDVVAAMFGIPPESPDYERRWLIALVGAFFVIVGVLQPQIFCNIEVSPELARIAQRLWQIIGFGVFATVSLAGGLLYGEEISGGIPFLSEDINNWLGRTLFTAFGAFMAVIVLGLAAHLFALVWRWIRGRR